MKYRIGYTINGQIIIQDMDTGDVTLLKDDKDEVGIFYPYEQWKVEEPKLADYSTIAFKFDPKNPGKPTESLEGPGNAPFNWMGRVQTASRDEILIFSGIVLLVIVIATWLIKRSKKQQAAA